MYSDNTIQEVSDFLQNLDPSLSEDNNSKYNIGYEAGFREAIEEVSDKITEMNDRLDQFKEEVDSGQIRLGTFDEIPDDIEITSEDLAEMVADKIADKALQKEKVK